MARDRIINEYFEWLCRLANGKKYRKLLVLLHSIPFTYLMENDANRAADGVNLRYQFAYEHNYGSISEYLNGPCSVLEMMLALSIRCEQHIMDDPDIGDRTSNWFWLMINNLGLKSMTDSNFNKSFVLERLDIFLKRAYEPNGEGGLFMIDNDCDMRTTEIWYQMCAYLNSIL